MKELQLTLASVSYRGTKAPILHDIRLTLPHGQMTAVIGRNGSGKSTLLRVIAGLMPFSGEVLYDGVSVCDLSVTERARRIAYMQQSLAAPHIPVETLVGFGRKPYLSLSDRMTDDDRDAVERAIAAADLGALQYRYLDTLSGGELRRTYLGMALAQETPILLLDEATANMDMDHEASFLFLLSSLAHNTDRTVVSVMHNMTAACRYADHIVALDDGGIVYDGTPEGFCTGDIPLRIFHARCVEVGERFYFETDREDEHAI